MLFCHLHMLQLVGCFQVYMLTIPRFNVRINYSSYINVVKNSTYDYKVLLNKAIFLCAGRTPLGPMTISISWIILFVKQVLGMFVSGIVSCN
jgi:hypothetical protein